MFNPFFPLTKPLLEAFVRSGKKYFVRQTYSRARRLLDEDIRGYFIFTHYSDVAHAQHHLKAIGEDPNRFLYDWDNADHRQKLLIAAGGPAGYKIYSSVFQKDWEKQLALRLKDRIKSYVDNVLCWKPGRAETVSLNIYVNYGELYAQIKLRSQEVRIRLEEIETR